ncbi:MAG: AmmeMemoRadiSam system radical SAM enzyme [Dehalococcoidia bacterium]
MTALPTVRPALLAEAAEGGRVVCRLCERSCRIPLGSHGFCKTRANIDGTLCTLVYGDLAAVASRPIEIKPFFHFWPGSRALTFCCLSCNFACRWCQNFHLSHAAPDPAHASYTPPQALLAMAKASGDQGICISFTEPTLLFEYACDLFPLAKANGLYTTMVSNGYLTLEALDALAKRGLDAIKIDVKGGDAVYHKYCGGVKAQVVWRNAGRAKALGLHVEIVALIVTGLNDDEQSLRSLIANHLRHVGPETPLHFTRYYPAYKFTSPPTPVSTLELAYRLAKAAGILYPYLGNVAGHPLENTYCPTCGELLVERYGYLLRSSTLTADNRCPRCRQPIPILGPISCA